MDALSNALRGAAAGAAATGPMTVVMYLARKTGVLAGEEVPPKRITQNLLNKLGIHHEMSQEEVQAVWTAQHVTFGAGAGAVYGLTAGALPVRSPAVYAGAGLAFGLLVWLTSYAGWLPATGLYPPPHKGTSRRPVTEIAAHVVYGAGTGLAFGLLSRGR